MYFATFTGMAAVAKQPDVTLGELQALLVAQGCFGYAFSSYFLLPKFLVTQLHAGPAEIGHVTALYGLFVVCCLPTMGAVVDRFGRRDFLTAGAVVMALASLAFIAVDRVGPLLFVLRAIQGVAFSMAFIAGATLAVDEAPPERLGQAIGIFGLTFLAICLALRAVVARFLSPPFDQFVGEGLLIVGWVAMWGPLDVFLYGWWPIAGRRRLFASLARLDVELRPLK